jgi:hypothetical protein
MRIGYQVVIPRLGSALGLQFCGPIMQRNQKPRKVVDWFIVLVMVVLLPCLSATFGADH